MKVFSRVMEWLNRLSWGIPVTREADIGLKTRLELDVDEGGCATLHRRPDPMSRYENPLEILEPVISTINWTRPSRYREKQITRKELSNLLRRTLKTALVENDYLVVRHGDNPEEDVKSRSWCPDFVIVDAEKFADAIKLIQCLELSANEIEAIAVCMNGDGEGRDFNASIDAAQIARARCYSPSVVRRKIEM